MTAMAGRFVNSVAAVPVPEARALTSPWRRPSALDAHVTLAAPFLDAAVIDEHVITAFHECLSDARSFDVVFRAVGWFDERVVYVAPDDPIPFERLAQTLARRFPADTSAKGPPSSSPTSRWPRAVRLRNYRWPPRRARRSYPSTPARARSCCTSTMTRPDRGAHARGSSWPRCP